MKFNKLFPLLFSLLLLSFLSGCGKDEDTGPSRTDLLTAGQWRGQSVWWDGFDITRELQEDEEFPYDVTLISILFDGRGTFLDTYDDYTSNGTWEFTDNEQSILRDRGTSYEKTIRIIKLTDTEFHYVESFADDGQADFEFRFIR